MKTEDGSKLFVKDEHSFDGTRPPEFNSVAFIDIEILSDDKFSQVSQISCLVIKNDDGESKRSFSARISPEYLDTYSHYKQSSDLLTILGQWVDEDSKRMLVKDKEEVVEVQTERQALTGLMEFLRHEKFILVYNSPMVIAMLRGKIGSEWVDETITRAVSLESLVKFYRPQLEVDSCDTEDLLAKVMARETVKLENCAAASSAMYELTNFVRMNHSKCKRRSLVSFILECSSPVIKMPKVKLEPLGLDDRSLTFIEVKSSYERSVCTLIQLSYIEILFLVDEEEDKVNNNLLIKPKKDEREAEYAEPGKGLNPDNIVPGGGGSFESPASSTKSEDSSDTSAAAANSTVITSKKDPTFPKSAAVPPPLLRTEQAPAPPAPPTNQKIGPSCYNALSSHTKCQPCRENDGSDQIQIPCKKCPRFKLITCGFAGSGKFCVALVVGLPKHILSLRVFIVKTNEFYCVPVFSDNARKFVMLDNSSAQVILPSTTISTERIGFAQVSCLDKEVWIRMKNETTEQFNEWLSQLVSVEDSRLTHTEIEERYPVQGSRNTVDVETVWFNEKDRLFLAKVPDSEKARKRYQNAEYLRVSDLPYESDSQMKGSFIFNGTNGSYILLPHVPMSFKGNTRLNFRAVADVMTLPTKCTKNIFTANQVAHQTSLMLAEAKRLESQNKKALAEQNGGSDNRESMTEEPAEDLSAPKKRKAETKPPDLKKRRLGDWCSRQLEKLLPDCD